MPIFTANVRAGVASLVVLTMIIAGCGGESATESADDSVRTVEPVAAPESDGGGTAADADAATDPVTEADGSGVDGDTDGDGVVSEAEQSAQANGLLLEFSQCMRENGFPDFEDMTVDLFAGAGANERGQAFFQAMTDRGIAFGSDEAGQAFSVCGTYLQQLQASAPEATDAELAEREAQVLEFAACMRENGVTDFPDPDFTVNRLTGYGPEIRDRFQNDPDVQAALGECNLFGGS